MSEVLSAILEIVKYTIPALIVFMTVYFILKKYLDQQYNLQALKFRQEELKNVLPLKLQAYERLSLFCERISPEQLIYRLNGPQMTAQDLRNAMMIAIQKEFEHNLTQQIYISENLWKIISLAKNEVINAVGSVKVENQAPSQDFIGQCLMIYRSLKIDPILQAQSAIKKETDIILK